MSWGDLGDLAITSETALVLDFDGTLADLADDPDTVRLVPETERALTRLTRRLDGAVAIVSGRDIADLARRTPKVLWRCGGHGSDIWPPGPAPATRAAALPPDLLSALETLAADHAGVRLEPKAHGVAVHYRAAPEAGPACWAAVERLGQAWGLRVQHGKAVVELVPRAASKGRALDALMAQPAFTGRRPLCLGDDVTDEDLFRAAREYDGIAVKVGPGETGAGRRAPDPSAVRQWLGREAASR